MKQQKNNYFEILEKGETLTNLFLKNKNCIVKKYALVDIALLSFESNKLYFDNIVKAYTLSDNKNNEIIYKLLINENNENVTLYYFKNEEKATFELLEKYVEMLKNNNISYYEINISISINKVDYLIRTISNLI